MKWIGQHIYDLISRFREDVYIEESDLSIYNPTTVGNPRIKMGANADESLQIVASYQSGTQSMQIARFTTFTESGTANDGRFQFRPDEVTVLDIDDGGIDFAANMGISIDGTDILTDSSGTATLSNIDALDATTIATFESALETNIDTLAGVTAIGAQGNTLTTSSYSVFDVDRTAAHGNAGAEDITALHVDFDRTVPTSGTYNHADTGIDLDVTSAGLGTHTVKGMDIDVVGTTDGTSTAYGIDLNVDSADTSIGMQITTRDTHLKLIAGGDVDDYATFTVADTGDLTIETVGDGTTDSDLTLNADGRIYLEPAAGACKVTSTVTSSASEGAKLSLVSNDGAALGDDHRLAKIGFQAAEDGDGTIREGASIQAFADAAWNTEVNDTRLEFYINDGNNSIEKALTLDSNLLATFAGAATITGLTTLSSGLTFDSVALTAVQTSGESFVDNDTSIMTSAAIDDKINTKYSYAYMTWSASASPTRDGSNNPEWMLPNTSKGIYEEDWNNDSGITSTTTGTTTYTFSRLHAANSLILPQAGILVGFHAIGRNSDSDLTFNAGLFHAANGSGSTGIDYGATGATNEYTLRCVATAVETEASGGTDGTSGHSFKGPCKLISNTANLAVAAGDALIPAIMGSSSNSTDEIFVTMTIILKIPLTT